MRVRWTPAAAADLDEALGYTARHFPAALPGLAARLRSIERHLAAWPEAGQRVADRPGVRVVALVRYPFRIFYVLEDDVVHILHFRHTARGDR